MVKKLGAWTSLPFIILRMSTNAYPASLPEFYSKLNFPASPNTLDLWNASSYHPDTCIIRPFPFRHDEKLPFPLCMTCAKNNKSDDERELVGTWCKPEVEKAVKMVYRISHAYEVWNLPQTSTTLFASTTIIHAPTRQAGSRWVAQNHWRGRRETMPVHLRLFKTRRHLAPSRAHWQKFRDYAPSPNLC